MRPCAEDARVTCDYGVPGSMWASGYHGGVDFGTGHRSPVYAAWSGRVSGDRTGGATRGTQWGSAYGNHLVVDHDHLPDGRAGLWAAYCHLDSLTVRYGDHVHAGQLIGYSDNTGNSSGPHLHFEVRTAEVWGNGSSVDPWPWIDAGDEDAVSPDDIEKIGKSVAKHVFEDDIVRSPGDDKNNPSWRFESYIMEGYENGRDLLTEVRRTNDLLRELLEQMQRSGQ